MAEMVRPRGHRPRPGAIMASMATDTESQPRPGGRPARRRAGASATARRSRGSTRRRPKRATSSRSRSATGCSSAAARSRPRTAARSPRVNPATEETLAHVAKRHPGRCRQGGPRRAPRPDALVGHAPGQGTGQVPVPHRADPPGAQPRVRRPRIDGLGQADQGEPRRRRAARGGPLLVLRGLGGQARVRLPGPRRASRSASPPRSSRGTSRC